MSMADYLDKKDDEGFNGLPMTQTCTMPRDMRPVSVETLTRAMQEIDLLPKPDQWLVVDPQGRMYKGTVEQMTRVLVQAHPLMRAMQEIDLLPKPDQWLVVDPQGRMYKGTVEQMTRVLVQAHPLMRTPFELSGSHDG